MSTPILSKILKNPDLAASYQEVYDLLKSAYWEATDVESKDLIYGAQQAIGEIITELDLQDIADNTAQFIALKPKIDATNTALATIKEKVDKITKNIATASMLAASITKVLSMFPV